MGSDNLPAETGTSSENLSRYTGSESTRFTNSALNDLFACLPLSPNASPETRQDRMGAAMDALASFGAKNEIEAMLAAQAVALHHAGMAALQKCNGMLPETASRLRRDGLSLFRAAAEMVETIDRRRSGGARQTVRIERVTVEGGAQAIIGAVTAGAAAPGGGG